jgi:tetraacyldisaccharide 4'-kinase
LFITKCSEGEDNSELIARIRKYNRTADIIECTHHPQHLRNLVTGEIQPLEFLRGLEVGALCGIAAPESFENGLRRLGAEVVLSKTYTDHHRYSVKEIENFIRRCARRDLPAILTTEKDAVRIPRILEPEVPMFYLRVEIKILAGHEHWRRFVDRLTTRHEVMAPERVF